MRALAVDTFRRPLRLGRPICRSAPGNHFQIPLLNQAEHRQRLWTAFDYSQEFLGKWVANDGQYRSTMCIN